MHLGLKIKVARTAKGLTQQDLADKINKTRPLISHIEQTGKVNSYTLNKICKALQVDITILESMVNERGITYFSGKEGDPAHYKEEIRRMNEEIKLLKELISSQKEIIISLREKINHKGKR
jgi:transcriptional regulator with XRE-family HTH domain